MKFTQALLFAFLASTSGIATVAVAQEPDLPALTDQQLDNRILEARKELKGDPRAFCPAERLLRELDRRAPNVAVLAEAEFFAAICSLADNDIPALWQHTQAAEALLPIRGRSKLRFSVESLALNVAAETKDPERYSGHLVHLAQIDDPANFATLNVDLVYAKLSETPQTFRDKAYLAFAEASNFDKLPGAFRQALGEFAVLPALQAGKRDVAIRMINQVSDIDHVYPLLLDRRYASLWPEIDQRVGPHQNRSAADFVNFAKADFAAEPENRWAYGDVVRSLTVAGRNREAITAFQSLPKDPQSVLHYQTGDGWAINAAVVAFDREGRSEEADQAFNLLTQLSPETSPWVLTLWINRANRLADQGRWVEAMSASKDVLLAAERYGSVFDQVTASATMVCIAVHQPSDAMVERANALLLLNAAKLPFHAAVAAICRGDKVAAKSFTLAALKNEDTRYFAILNLQPHAASKLPVAPKSAVADLGEFVRSDPELVAELNRHGRFLPTELNLMISNEIR